MKKNLFFAALVAVALVSCSSEDVIEQAAQNEVQIGFGETYVGKTTRNAGEISSKALLEVDGNTMEVWGWKTVSAADTKVFNAQTVTYTSGSAQTTTKWVYSPLKYWDMNATQYAFYAVAPASSKFGITDDTRIISCTGVEPVQILNDNNGASKVTTSTAVDYLVAAKVAKAPKGNASDNDVEFTFSHILSKLDVQVKTTSDFNNTGSTYPQIKVNTVSINLSGMCPNYTQKTTGVTTASATAGDTWSGTAMSAADYTCFQQASGSVDPLLLSTTATSVAKYLVAPTATGASPAAHAYTVTVDYDIYYSATEHENFVAPNKEISTLTGFVQNTANTLTITVGPKAIYFDVNTISDWTAGSDGTATVQ